MRPWHTSDGDPEQERALDVHLLGSVWDRHERHPDVREHDGLRPHQHAYVLPRPGGTDEEEDGMTVISKGTEREYGPAAMLLNEVWWAKPFVHEDGIDWQAILNPSISPSDGERALIELAHSLWIGPISMRVSDMGFMRCMSWLDERNQRLVLDALRWRFFGEVPDVDA